MPEKPPIGVMPQKIWQERVEANRMQELADAILRYLSGNRCLPAEWVEEYNTLRNRLSLDVASTSIVIP